MNPKTIYCILVVLGAVLWLIAGGMDAAGAGITNIVGVGACGMACIIAALLIWGREKCIKQETE